MIDNSKHIGAAIDAHYQLLAWLLPTVANFPRSHKFTLADRIEITALDVLEALIEATNTRDRAQQLRRANLGIEKLRFLIQTGAAASRTNTSSSTIRSLYPASCRQKLLLASKCPLGEISVEQWRHSSGGGIDEHTGHEDRLQRL